MKKIILLSGALCVIVAASASAQVSVSVGQPVYVERPVYYTPPLYTTTYVEYERRYPRYNGHGHARRDWSYWARQNEKHDNGNHGKGNRGNGYGNGGHR